MVGISYEPHGGIHHPRAYIKRVSRARIHRLNGDCVDICILYEDAGGGTGHSADLVTGKIHFAG
jgi:hypothetical protein